MLIKVDCNDRMPVSDWLSANFVSAKFLRGSLVYGTDSPDSDTDCGLVVNDLCSFTDIKREPGRGTGRDSIDFRIHMVNADNEGHPWDLELVRASDFIEMIKEHNVFALEGIFADHMTFDIYGKYFKLNTWKLRESFCKVASNSWVKAKKKMEEGDTKAGVKSLFHSLRILEYGSQIAKWGRIKDFGTAKSIWEEIKNDRESGYTWEDFKNKYKPIYNARHSALVKLCPKPEECEEE